MFDFLFFAAATCSIVGPAVFAHRLSQKLARRWQMLVLVLLFLAACSTASSMLQLPGDPGWRMPFGVVLLCAIYGGTLGIFWRGNPFRGPPKLDQPPGGTS